MNDNEAKTNEEQNNEQQETKKKGRPRLLNLQVTEKEVIDAIKQTGGRIMDTCAILGMTVSNFYDRFRYHKPVEEALYKARRIGFEKVTEVLMDRCLKGDTKAIALYLKFNPVARSEGWTSSETFTFKSEKPLSDDEKENLTKELFG